MIQDRIAQIEAKLASAPDLPDGTRAELAALLADLKSEVATLAGARAQTITDTTDAAISQATAPTEGGADVLSELRASVEGFEASHPRLVQVVDRIALALSNMGI